MASQALAAMKLPLYCPRNPQLTSSKTLGRGLFLTRYPRNTVPSFRFVIWAFLRKAENWDKVTLIKGLLGNLVKGRACGPGYGIQASRPISRANGNSSCRASWVYLGRTPHPVIVA